MSRIGWVLSLMVVFVSMYSVAKDAVLDEEKAETNIILNGDFHQESAHWTLSEGVYWGESRGVDSTGGLVMEADYVPPSAVIREARAETCVSLRGGRQFDVEAAFRYTSLPALSSGHRLNIVWYEDDQCQRGGQFGLYIEPVRQVQWQRVGVQGRLPALNAQAVKVQLVQHQSHAAEAVGIVTHWWYWILDWFGIEYTRALAVGVWDNIYVGPTQDIGNEAVPSKESLVASAAQPLGENRVKNGGFDEDAQHWRVSGAHQWVETEGVSLRGALQTTLTSTKGSMGTGVFSQCVNVNPQHHYAMGIQFKRSVDNRQAGGGRFRPTWYELPDCKGRHTISHLHADPVEGEGWQALVIPRLVPASGALSVKMAAIQVINGPGTFSALWDDAYLIGIAPSSH